MISKSCLELSSAAICVLLTQGRHASIRPSHVACTFRAMVDEPVLLQFRLDYALSREQQNKNGGKMYIQDKASIRTP